MSRTFQPGRPAHLAHLTDEFLFALAAPILEAGGTWQDVAAAAGCAVCTAWRRCTGMGLRSRHPRGGLIGRKLSPEAKERMRQGPLSQRVPLPGGRSNPLYRKLRRAGIPRDAAIAECRR